MPELSSNAQEIAEKRYFYTEENEDSWNKLSKRIGSAVAAREYERIKWTDIFASEIYDMYFIPGGRILRNAGRRIQSMMNCVCLPISDSIEEIGDTIKNSLIMWSYGSGIGVDFSSLRNKGALLKSKGGVSCITGDTELYRERKKSKDFNIITVEELYKKILDIGYHPHKIRSADLSNNTITHDYVEDIIYQGMSKVYKVTTNSGYKIKATMNHRFLSENGWLRLKEFSIGDLIAVNGTEDMLSECIRCNKKRILRRRGKYVGLCNSCATSLSKVPDRAIKGSKEDFERRSLSHKIHKRKYVGRRGEDNSQWKGDYANEKTARDRIKTYHPQLLEVENCERCGVSFNDNRREIHHKDKNPYNNDIENLEVLCRICHMRHHMRENNLGNGYTYRVLDYDSIKSIEYLGEEEVYDLVMRNQEQHNFIANGFVSHNSGMVSFMKAIDSVAHTIETGGQRRCLDGDAFIFTSEGLTKIKDINVGDYVITTNGLKKVSNKFFQGKQKLYVVHTNSHDIFATENHRFAVLDNKTGSNKWKQVNKLTDKDRLLHFKNTVDGVKTYLPEDFTEDRPKKSTTCREITIPDLDVDIAWLIGVIHGDGFIHNRNTCGYKTSGASRIEIAFNSKDSFLYKRVQNILSRFGVDAKIKNRNNENCSCVIANSQRLSEYFERFIKIKNSDINVPDFIYKAKSDIVGSYLAGLFDSDGSLYSEPVVLLSSIYPKFIRQVCSLYSSLGIPVRLKHKKRKNSNWKDMYTISLVSFRERYNKYVGVYSSKGYLELQRLDRSGFSIPRSIVISQLRDKDYRSIWHKGIEDMSYTKFIKCGGKINYIPIRIKSIEDINLYTDTYDIEVEDDHEFFVDGVLSHNSGMLGMCKVSHPEIEDFIDAKLVDGELSYFNISVAVDSHFLRAVEENKDWDLTFDGITVKTLKARYLWSKILDGMIKSGEPGLIHYDNLIKNNSYYCQRISCVNLCSELPLPAFGACCLGNLILPNFTSGKTTNWKKLEESIKYGIRFLDNVVDINFYPIRQMERTSLEARRIGLGVTGLHTYLIKKELRYGSEEALNEIDKLFKFIRNISYLASIELAKEKGTFPSYIQSEFINASFVKKLPPKIRMKIKEDGIRNVCVNTCPPVGTVSLIADVSSGIEPLYALAYERKDRVSDRVYIDPKLKELLSNNMDIPEYLVDSHSLSPEDHLDVQSTCQRYIDSGISKTVNCPADITKSKLSSILLEYINHVKGLTIYVDKTRKNQVLNRMSIEEAKKYLETSDSNIDEEAVGCSTGSCEI